MARLFAGPDPALRDLVDLFRRHVPGRSGAFHELVVDRLHRLGDPLALVRGEAPIGRRHLGLLPAADRFDVGAELLEAAGGDELAGVDPNRSGQRAWLGDNRVAGQRNVIATRGGEVGHRDD